MKRILPFLVLCFALAVRLPALAQNSPAPINPERAAAGDEPDNPGPLATNLSPAMKRAAILKAVKLVADWQLQHVEGRYNIDWTYAALYDGMLAASRATGDPRYHDRVLHIANDNRWKLGPRLEHADDEHIGLTYLTLYSEDHNPDHLAPAKDSLDKLLVRPDDPQNNLWWWCDALYMAPPVLAQLSVITGDRRYLDFMDHEWSLTRKALYDPQEHLYFRDDRFLTMHEPNGQKIFWSRGNGWVLAGLALLLERMPQDYPQRAEYVAQYRDMAARIASLQPADGVWRSGLLDPDAYRSPEISGTAFYTFAIAWGVNHGLLDKKTMMPIVAKAWRGMLTHIYQDGRLGSIQPIGAAPDKFSPSSSYVYGVGAFLMAGSELAEMTK